MRSPAPWPPAARRGPRDAAPARPTARSWPRRSRSRSTTRAGLRPSIPFSHAPSRPPGREGALVVGPPRSDRKVLPRFLECQSGGGSFRAAEVREAVGGSLSRLHAPSHRVRPLVLVGVAASADERRGRPRALVVGLLTAVVPPALTRRIGHGLAGLMADEVLLVLRVRPARN